MQFKCFWMDILAVLDQMELAGTQLGIGVHDSIIVNGDGEWVSCAQQRSR